MSDKWSEICVLYKFQCNDRSATYIGQTKRKVKKRINEHKNTPLDKLLSIPKHLKENPPHSFNFDKVQIINREINKYKRLIREIIHINTHSHTINRQENTQFLSKQ